MKLAILSRGPQLYSTQSLYDAAVIRGHSVQVIDHAVCNLVLQKGQPKLHYNGFFLQGIDAIIPRIGASITSVGAAVIQQFEAMGTYSITRATALLLARDKLESARVLTQKGIDIPKTVFVNTLYEIKDLVQELGGFPMILKLLKGTHGEGVILVESQQALESTIEAFGKLRQRLLMQEFIQEAKGEDFRAIVVGDQVVASMMRQAKEGEFRSNLHRGAQSELVVLSQEEEMVAVKATKILGLEVAGVDILRSHRGPLIMEVNPSPGLEGIESTTEIDIAGKIIDHLERRYKKFKKKQNYPKNQS